MVGRKFKGSKIDLDLDDEKIKIKEAELLRLRELRLLKFKKFENLKLGKKL